MPIFDYECPKCGNVEEHFDSSDSSISFNCSECGDIVERQVSFPAAFDFKGQGTYDKGFKRPKARQKPTDKK